MPIWLPPKARARTGQARKDRAEESFDWLGAWTLSLGFCGVNLAAVAYFVNGDNTGASAILVGAATIMAAIVRFGGSPKD